MEELSAEIDRHLAEVDRRLGSEEPPPESGTTGETSAGGPLPPMSHGQAWIVRESAPRVNQNVAELGVDMRRFSTPEQAAAWTGVAPGNHESGGKRYSGRIRKGNFALRTTLVQAAWAAVRTRDTYLKALIGWW